MSFSYQPMVEAFFLGILQGVTEFLPVSSSMHITLIEYFSQSKYEKMEIFLHLGTLVTIVCHLRKQVLEIFYSSLNMMIGKFDAQAEIILKILFATLPVVLLGTLFHVYELRNSTSFLSLGCSSILFGTLLYLSDIKKEKIHEIISYKSAVIIGLAQCASLYKGGSRLGLCLTAAMFLGVKRKEALNFSLLLSIPAVGGAVVLNLSDLVNSDFHYQGIVACLVSMFSGLVVVNLLVRWLESKTFAPVAIYRIALGAYMLMHI